MKLKLKLPLPLTSVAMLACVKYVVNYTSLQDS